MKLRRALVTAAATAAIAPIALLSAPGAFADGVPGTTTETTATTPDPSATESASAEETPPSDAGTTPAAEETTPTADDRTPAQIAPAKTPRSTPPETTDPVDECTEFEDDPGTLAELRGLPSKIVAGSGWHDFTYRVSNYTGKAFVSWSADLIAFSYAYDGEDATETTRYLHVQWFDGSAWHKADSGLGSTHESFGNGGPLAPGAHADVKLRIAVDAKAPAGLGASFAFATSVDADGVCSDSVPEDQEYNFEILPATAQPGKVPPATAQPKPRPSNTPAPQSSSTPLAGSLASTGSSSMLPTVGIVGGVAVLAGAGVVYAVRRRKVSDDA
ncbi:MULTISPECIES: LPXTG cell wall anchor domain-containing protein [unclassified Streptomyces]|uniref:LPXTG cell wall anchor domain-containing protein n=1 Tax=unclassified Streptomyces TaxID=2593676 RepID=UPI000DB9836F|nr:MULTISPECIES: LPXTG cell wall anchor domain-containing protein [unclassified Streptomyces]MYT68579.1 LPXTG cell wall anchor domain-containing protein [Streptomyces sp. SID8367]RAJ86251.1 LPXTG-motif cell wall-anchored protein [Streptomyces sp. PsTaAH-137]